MLERDWSSDVCSSDLFCGKCVNKVNKNLETNCTKISKKNKTILIISIVSILIVILAIIVGNMRFQNLKKVLNFESSESNNEKTELENASKIIEDFVKKLNSENDRKYKNSIKAIQYNSKDSISNVSSVVLQNTNLEIKYIEKYSGIDIYYIYKNNGEQIYYINGDVGNFKGVMGFMSGKYVDGLYVCYDSDKSNELNTDTIMFYHELEHLKFLVDRIEANKNT